MSAVAMIARQQGYKVSGCDLLESTPYLDKVKKLKIPVCVGHNSRHLEGVDVLAVTPATFFQSKKHPEFLLGKKLNKLMTWQEFLGSYLHRNKQVICIAGTHGKSTTTAMAGLLFESANRDPNVVIGATVKKWNANYRTGKSKIFITEGDEFFDNFLNYRPDTIILNNIEFDHPDFFKSETHVLKSFEKFIQRLSGSKTLIINQDSPGIKKLLDKVDKRFLRSINLVGYTLKDKPVAGTSKSLRAKVIKRDAKGTIFETKSQYLGLDTRFSLQIPGVHNVANALGVIILAKLFDIETPLIKKSLASYAGIGRRMDLIGRKNKVKVYDDYAHHPTAIKATLRALRQLHKNEKIWAVVEAHSYSRTKALLDEYKRDVFSSADCVIIGPIFKARDKDSHGISGRSIVDRVKHKDIRYLDSSTKIIGTIRKSARAGDVILVMGAGLSYEWAREILKSFR